MSKAWTPIQRMRAGKRMGTDSDHEVQGYWRGYSVWCELSGRNGDWYIQVMHPDGGFLYDGWWPDSFDRSAEEAVAEAFRGACLLEQPPAA